MTTKLVGTVRFFDWDKNYGYVATEAGDVFVDASAIRRQQAREMRRSHLLDRTLPKALHVGQKVVLDVALNKQGRMQGANVDVIADAPYAFIATSTPTATPASSPTAASTPKLTLSQIFSRSEISASRRSSPTRLDLSLLL